MDKLLKRLLIAFVILILLVPVGLLAAGTAYGEWSTEELQQLVGFVPEGLGRLSELWHPPLPDYAVPGSPDTFLASSLAYYLSAIIGAIIGGGALFLIGKALTRNAPKRS
jgi:cobalt/nickel transport system permease protein/cobalt/nickel transport protein